MLPACSAAVQCLFVVAALYERGIAQQELRRWQLAQQPWQPQDEQGEQRVECIIFRL